MSQVSGHGKIGYRRKAVNRMPNQTEWARAKRWVMVSAKTLREEKRALARRNRRIARLELANGRVPDPPDRLNGRDIS